MKHSSSPAPKKLIIVGAGFAGVAAARHIARDPHYQVTLISDSDNFTFYPLLYHMATGYTRLAASFPLRFLLLDKPAVSLVKAKITDINTDKHTLTAEDGTAYSYDTAVLGLGMVTSYFNLPGIEKYALGTKSESQALVLRRHLHDEYKASKGKGYTVVVAGGGPTGVELSAGIVEYLEHIAKVHSLPADSFEVRLVEAGPQLLRYLPKWASNMVARRLKRLGVKVYTGTAIESQTATDITIGGEKIATKSVVWTAGVTNNPFFAQSKAFTISERGKVVTDQHFLAAPDVYVIGDNTAMPDAGLAEVAVVHGKYVAKLLHRQAQGKTMPDYHQHTPTSVVPVGHGWAVANYKKLVLAGWPGSLLRKAGDLIAYHDVAPLPLTVALWLAENQTENECPECVH